MIFPWCFQPRSRLCASSPDPRQVLSACSLPGSPAHTPETWTQHGAVCTSFPLPNQAEFFHGLPFCLSQLEFQHSPFIWVHSCQLQRDKTPQRPKSGDTRAAGVLELQDQDTFSPKLRSQGTFSSWAEFFSEHHEITQAVPLVSCPRRAPLPSSCALALGSLPARCWKHSLCVPPPPMYHHTILAAAASYKTSQGFTKLKAIDTARITLRKSCSRGRV